VSMNSMNEHLAGDNENNLARPGISAHLRLSRRRVIAISLISLVVGVIAAFLWLYFGKLSPWATADKLLDSVHIPEAIFAPASGARPLG
jgi:hypothetical protein